MADGSAPLNYHLLELGHLTGKQLVLRHVISYTFRTGQNVNREKGGDAHL